MAQKHSLYLTIVFYFSLFVCVIGGRTVDGHGEGEAGIGVHES